jgi:hypothetical protein
MFTLSPSNIPLGLCFSAMFNIDAGASQASQCRDNGQLEKSPTKILKYLETLMNPSSGGTLVKCKWTLSDLLSSLVGGRHL